MPARGVIVVLCSLLSGLLGCASHEAIESRSASSLVENETSGAARGSTPHVSGGDSTSLEPTGPLRDPWDTPEAIGAGAPDPRDRALLSACGRGDFAVATVALAIASDATLKQENEVVGALRREGVNDPWARWMTLRGPSLDREIARQRVQAWAADVQGGERRCGIASVRTAEGEVIAVVAVPRGIAARVTPSEARVGTWVSLDALVPEHARVTRVTVLAPGASSPLSIPYSVYRGALKARFSADRAGAWQCSITADTGEGPRPMAELEVRAGTTSAASTTRSLEGVSALVAPGEEAASVGAHEDEREALGRMLDGARRSVGARTLQRDPALDRLAEAHARTMARAGKLGHDVGDGDPSERVLAAGERASVVGENVARSSTLVGAHRSLWASIAHRENLLSARFTHVGVSVVRDDDGAAWVVELFVGR